MSLICVSAPRTQCLSEQFLRPKIPLAVIIVRSFLAALPRLPAGNAQSLVSPLQLLQLALILLCGFYISFLKGQFRPA